jgi:hypothetical protein
MKPFIRDAGGRQARLESVLRFLLNWSSRSIVCRFFAHNYDLFTVVACAAVHERRACRPPRRLAWKLWGFVEPALPYRAAVHVERGFGVPNGSLFGADRPFGRQR